MEPEWNTSDCNSDAVVLGLRSCENKSNLKFLDDREWFKSFSFKKRICYISGQDITWKIAYIGRKDIKSLLSQNRPIYDDIWVSEKAFKEHCYSNIS